MSLPTSSASPITTDVACNTSITSNAASGSHNVTLIAIVSSSQPPSSPAATGIVRISSTTLLTLPLAIALPLKTVSARNTSFTASTSKLKTYPAESAPPRFSSPPPTISTSAAIGMGIGIIVTSTTISVLAMLLFWRSTKRKMFAGQIPTDTKLTSKSVSQDDATIKDSRAATPSTSNLTARINSFIHTLESQGAAHDLDYHHAENTVQESQQDCHIAPTLHELAADESLSSNNGALRSSSSIYSVESSGQLPSHNQELLLDQEEVLVPSPPAPPPPPLYDHPAYWRTLSPVSPASPLSLDNIRGTTAILGPVMDTRAQLSK